MHKNNTFAAATETGAEYVESVLKAAAKLMDSANPMATVPTPSKMAELVTGCTIGYSRQWLMARREHLLNHFPNLIQDTPKAECGPVVRTLRDEQGLSWGEISVRINVPESAVRGAYKLASGLLDVGQRIGKGGRFVADNPLPYEGALRPTGVKADAAGAGTSRDRVFAKAQEVKAAMAKAAEPKAPRKASAKKAVAKAS